MDDFDMLQCEDSETLNELEYLEPEYTCMNCGLTSTQFQTRFTITNFGEMCLPGRPNVYAQNHAWS